MRPRAAWTIYCNRVSVGCSLHFLSAAATSAAAPINGEKDRTTSASPMLWRAAAKWGYALYVYTGEEEKVYAKQKKTRTIQRAYLQIKDQKAQSQRSSKMVRTSSVFKLTALKQTTQRKVTRLMVRAILVKIARLLLRRQRRQGTSRAGPIPYLRNSVMPAVLASPPSFWLRYSWRGRMARSESKSALAPSEKASKRC